VSSLLTPPARRVDPRGQRFGAGFSAVILVAAFVLNVPVVVALVGLALFVSSAFGTRFWILGKPWPAIKRVLRLGPTDLEHEYPPRFAQALGFIALVLAVAGFAVGLPVVGWSLTGAVVALQTLLAVSGICVGCRLYFLRWYVPSLYARLITGRTANSTGIPNTTLRAPR